MRSVSTTIALLLFAAAAACGSEASTFPPPGGGASGALDDPNRTPLPDIGPSGTSSACVTELASAELAPTNLVIIYDKSGSMGDTRTGFDPAKRWIPVGTGLKDFFADPYSRTVRASLQFFPLSDDTIETTCAHAYGRPVVEMTPANDRAIVDALDRTTPSGGTPTLPALEGAIAYAKEVANARPGEKTIVVLVTDGEPGFWNPATSTYVAGCPNNDVAHVAAAAEAARLGAPAVGTYVIGVGPKLEALNGIAAAGGTGAAIMVDANEPTATKTSIVGALDGIRRKESSCDFAMPKPPEGESLDPMAVNIALRAPDGAESVLSYSKDCATPDGWRYDDPNQPGRVVLCQASCDVARRSAGNVAIAFGCKTKLSLK
jgi:hypothetical protein